MSQDHPAGRYSAHHVATTPADFQKGGPGRHAGGGAAIPGPVRGWTLGLDAGGRGGRARVGRTDRIPLAVTLVSRAGLPALHVRVAVWSVRVVARCRAVARLRPILAPDRIAGGKGEAR